MGRYASNSGGEDFAQPEAGSHIARSFRIIDIGTHHSEFKGKPKVRNQFILQWELPNELVEFDGKEMPMVVSKFYTNTLYEKGNLRPDLEAWRSKPFTPEEEAKFDLEAVLGKPCMLSIVITDKGKTKVGSVSSMPKGMTCPPAVHPVSTFWIDEFDQAKFDALSEGFKRLVMESDEYLAMKAPPQGKPAGTTNDDDDSIPF